MMRPVSVFAGEQPNERRISARDMRDDEFFFYVVFAGESKSAIVKFSSLSPTELNVQTEGMTQASKWKTGEAGDIVITDGSKPISYVRAGSVVDYNIVTSGAGSSSSPDISSLQTQISALESRVNSLDAEFISDDYDSDNSGRVAKLEAAKTALSLRIDYLEDEVISALEERIAELEGLISASGGGDIGDLTGLIASVNELNSWKNIANAELASTRDDLNDVSAELNGADGLLNWRNEASASINSLETDTAYLITELASVKTTLDEITASGRVLEHTGASPITKDEIGTSSFAYVTFNGIAKGELVQFSLLSESPVPVGPVGAALKSNWSKSAPGDVSYTTGNPAINGVWICNEAAAKELELQNRRFNTLAENVTALETSLVELSSRVSAIEEGMGAALLAQPQIALLKDKGFTDAAAANAAALDGFFNQDGRKFFFALNNAGADWVNMPVEGTVSGNVELTRTGNILSCVVTINQIDGELTYRAYQGYWNISPAALAWQDPDGSRNGWISVVSGSQLSVGVTEKVYTFTQADVICRKSLNVVSVIVVQKSPPWTNNALIGTITDNAFKPPCQLNQFANGSGSWDAGVLSLGTDGKLVYHGGSSSGSQYNNVEYSWIAPNADPAHILSVASETVNVNSNLYVKKNGGVWGYYVNITTGAGSLNTIGTLPAGSRPQTELQHSIPVAALPNGVYNFNCFLTIGTDGVVKYQTNNASPKAGWNTVIEVRDNNDGAYIITKRYPFTARYESAGNLYITPQERSIPAGMVFRVNLSGIGASSGGQYIQLTMESTFSQRTYNKPFYGKEGGGDGTGNVIIVAGEFSNNNELNVGQEYKVARGGGGVYGTQNGLTALGEATSY
jgi:hypothetical protein